MAFISHDEDIKGSCTARLGSAVFVKPGTGIGAGGLTGQLLLEGVMIGGFYQGGRYSSITDGPGDICVDDVHDLSSDDICKISRMAFCLDLEASQVFIMLYSCFHRTTVFPERNSLLRHAVGYQKGCRYFRRDSLAYEPKPKRIWVTACEVWERVA